MHAVVELLSLLFPLLRRLDAPLAAHLEEAGLGEGPPIFALAWLITWFAHGVSALPTAARLFDAFLASHPLLPLYAAAAAMKACRQVVWQPLAEWQVSPAHAELCYGAEAKQFTWYGSTKVGMFWVGACCCRCLRGIVCLTLNLNPYLGLAAMLTTAMVQTCTSY